MRWHFYVMLLLLIPQSKGWAAKVNSCVSPAAAALPGCVGWSCGCGYGYCSDFGCCCGWISDAMDMVTEAVLWLLFTAPVYMCQETIVKPDTQDLNPVLLSDMTDVLPIHHSFIHYTHHCVGVTLITNKCVRAIIITVEAQPRPQPQ